MKVQVLMAALLAAAGITLNAAPKVVNNVIIYGDKKVICAKNGDIIIGDAKGKISETHCHYSIINPTPKKTVDWDVFKEKDCTMTFKDNKFTWVLNRKAFGKTWKGVDQTLEILPDGRLKLTVKKYPAPAGLKLYDNCVFTLFPLASYENKTIKYNGKDVKLTLTKAECPFNLPRVKNVKGANYTFPATKGTVGFSSSDTNSGVSGYRPSKTIRLSWYLISKDMTGTIFFDLK